ncbi:Ferritin-like domain protein [Lignipirellula cremea]|uniref:Ferritin-like domain protein n=2 Tax=Lignipirellula cremea TaxID=2528010 RepID=A0A518DPI6_9BACT|nr:Ferritin-like domain protein [Lignipirellula cremea]
MSKLIDKMNEILRHEWTGVAQYSQAGFVISGHWRQVFAEMFFDSAEESFGHAKLVGEKISALGSVPTVERNAVKQSQNLDEILQFSLEFEQKAVEYYSAAIGLAEEMGDRALVIFLEDILKEEQEGVDEITKLMRDKIASGSGKKGATKAG